MRQETGVQTTCQEGLKGVRRATWDPLEAGKEERKVGGGDSAKARGQGSRGGDNGLGVYRGRTAASAPGTERRFVCFRGVFVSLKLSLYFVFRGRSGRLFTL